MQLKREAKLLTVIGLNTKHADLLNITFSLRSGLFEGGPSKSCTFLITQDCAIGIICNLYYVYICISQISYHILNEFAFII